MLTVIGGSVLMLTVISRSVLMLTVIGHLTDWLPYAFFRTS